jgi:outer membrane biosynthesis protein TonB
VITSSYAWRSNRIVRWGLLVSLILHILLAMLYFAVQPWLLRALHRPVAPLPRSREEIVTISNARKIERHDRVRVQTGHPAPPPHRQVVATVRKPLTQAAPPVAPVVPRPRPVVTPVPQPPTKRVHEIVKRVAQATPEPPKTVKEKTVTEVASAPPATPIPKRDEPSAAPEKQVALGETPRQAQRPPRQFSPEQLQKINDDLAKSIAQDRAENNPLNTRTYQTPAATTRHFAFQLSGVDGRMRVPQGLCSPIKSWVADGWDYYYVSCNVAFSDGTSDIEAVPWPVRFAPKEDYFRYDVRPVSTDLALPLPGWTLSPGIVVGEGVRAYARAHGFNL